MMIVGRRQVNTESNTESSKNIKRVDIDKFEKMITERRYDAPVISVDGDVVGVRSASLSETLKIIKECLYQCIEE